MSFWAAIPVIGSLFEKIGEAIDRNVTTDEERLRLKSEITQHQIPIIAAVVEAQKSFNDMQAKIAVAEAGAEHWIVYSRRPIISILAALNFLIALWMASGGLIGKDIAEFSFYFAMAANGLDMGTRGIEKIVRTLKAKEQI